MRNLAPSGGRPVTVSSLTAGAVSAKSPRPPVRKPQSHHRTSKDLELPKWLPSPVTNYARQINCRTKSDELMLRRLTSDPRMRTVWTELLKRKRTNYKASDTFKHQPTDRIDWNVESRELLRRAQAIRGISGPDAGRAATEIEVGAKFFWAAWTATTAISELSIQERALVALFVQAFEFARTESRPVPRAVARQRREHYLDMANRIRTDIVELDLFSNQVLTDAAFAYEALADTAAPPPGHPLHVQRRRRGNERQIAFVRQLAEATKAIFGHSLYGTVATVANVAFECDYWTDARVSKIARP
jgi:hypothetical protein